MSGPAERAPSRHGVQARRLGTQGPPGELWLPVCPACGRCAYPLRELCPSCLSDGLEWRPVAPGATVLAVATLQRSNEPWFRPRLPLRVASVRLDAGPVALVFLDGADLPAGARVRVRIGVDDGAATVLVASAATISAEAISG